MRFYKVTVAGSFLPDAPSTRKLGDVGSEFLEVHSDDFIGDLTGDVTGDLTGDVYSSNATKILESGIDGSDAWFEGEIHAEDGSVIVQSGTTHTNSSFRGGQVLAANGDIILGMPTGAAALRIKDIRDGVTGLEQLMESGTLTTAWWRGQVRSEDGGICLDNDIDVINSKFFGQVFYGP